MTHDALAWRWEPLALADAALLAERAAFHHDLDLAVARRDHALVFELFSRGGWDCQVAAAGQLAPWRGEPLPAGKNNVWCRRSGEPVWRIDLVMTEIDGGDWVFRRDQRVRLQLDEAITAGPPPYVSPHVQLLFKARHRRPQDDADLAHILPRLDHGRRRWLHDTLCSTEGADHPWVAFTAAPV